MLEVALSGREFSRRDFAVFTAKRDGSSSAFVEKGMTYLSGDQAYLGEGKDQGEKTAFLENVKNLVGSLRLAVW